MPTNKTKMGEILHKRTINSKTWINFDGSHTTQMYGTPVHYEDEDGVLRNINTDLYDEADFDVIDEPVTKEAAFDFKVMKKTAEGLKKDNLLNRDNMDYQALKVPFEAKIPRNFRRGYTIGKGKDRLTFKPVNASPGQGFINGNNSCIEYQDVWNDADVCLVVQPNGIKETIILKTDRAPSSFSFEVQGNIDTLTELKLHNAWLKDSQGIKRDVEQNIRKEAGKTYIDLIADVSGLTYPIEIDPTVTFQAPEVADVYVESTNPTVVPTGTELQIGRGTGINRSLFKFDVSSLPSGAVVSDAFVHAYVLNSYVLDPNAPPSSYSVYELIGSFTEGTTWNEQPFVGATYSTFPGPMSEGYMDIDITSIVQEWIDGETNNGFGIRATDEQEADTLFVLDSSEDPTAPLSVSVTYSVTPSVPVLTSPNGGETWNAEHTITWTASTDFENDTLSYQIQLSTDNGTNWRTIIPEVSGTSVVYNFINEPESSICLLRIRAYDGTSYSNWDTSDGVFTINHNEAPSIPTNLSPAGGEPVDNQATVQLSWQHNDENSNDLQSKFDLQWRVVGSSTWTTVSEVTTNNFYTAPGGTFPVDSNIEWRVRTYDQGGLSSPYSAIANFFAGNKPERPTITYPSGSDVPVANPTVQWSSAEQVSYLLEIYEGTTLIYSHTGGSNKAHTVQYDLVNNTLYELRLSITNADGLVSDPRITNFYVNYTPPTKPVLSLLENDATGTITLEIEFPAPSGTQPETVHYDVHRRLQGDDYFRIAKEVDPEINYVDVTPESDGLYFYYIRAWGANNTYTESNVVTGSITLGNALIHRVDNPTEFVELDKVTGTSHESGVERSTLSFAGRNAPVAYFGQMDEWSIGTDFLVKGHIAMKALRNLANSREILLYRDERGRKAFITLAGVSESDVIGNDYYRVNFSPIQTYYDEEV